MSEKIDGERREKMAVRRGTAKDKKNDKDKVCVVTVGTTRFNDLISVVSGDEFTRILQRRGFTRLVMQVGSGELPRGVEERGGGGGGRGSEEAMASDGDYLHESGIEVSWFRFKPEFGKVISEADLVVSHAGSGSIFEALGARRNLIVVVNTKLMDNHQQELANRLCQDGTLMKLQITMSTST